MSPALAPVLTGLAVAVAVGVRPVWRWLRNAVTFVHETGHALAALACGGRVGRIRLRFDTSGDTSWSFRGRAGRARRFAVAAAGYPAAPAAGLAVAWAVAAGHGAVAMVVVAVAWLVVSVVWVRSAWGVCCALAGAAAGAAAWWSGHTRTALDVVGWLWLLGGVRASWELTGRPTRRGDPSDPGQMAAAVPSPAGLWVGAFVLVAAAAAAAGGWLLLSAERL
jgi:hypothetical protein